ncbi:hypothetical protein RR46_06096 [Papilio xuthus]|uniref:Uncharacterized protein n=1 Tax=Papilio xuthus TaxID=66420 RepID=A0A194Q9Y1_PAPXU|nr:hypothetical protein RR46_06096 [Papilio xuthus]
MIIIYNLDIDTTLSGRLPAFAQNRFDVGADSDLRINASCASVQSACAATGCGAMRGAGRADSSAGRAGADATRVLLIDTTPVALNIARNGAPLHSLIYRPRIFRESPADR